MVKYVGGAEFDYHSLNYGRSAHAARAEVATYTHVAIVAAIAIIADVGRISVVIERINVVIAGGCSLINATVVIIPIDTGLFSIPHVALKSFQVFNAFCSFMSFATSRSFFVSYTNSIYLYIEFKFMQILYIYACRCKLAWTSLN